MVRAKIKQLDDAVKAIDKDILSLQDELTAITEKRDKARESIQQLRKQRDDGVYSFCLLFAAPFQRAFLYSLFVELELHMVLVCSKWIIRLV